MLGSWIINLDTQVGGISQKVYDAIEKVVADKGKVASEEMVERVVGEETVERYREE